MRALARRMKWGIAGVALLGLLSALVPGVRGQDAPAEQTEPGDAQAADAAAQAAHPDPVDLTPDSLAVLPPAVTLSGPHAAQGLVVEGRRGERFVGDLTAQATFASSNPDVAAVDEAGNLTPRADGTATVTATVGAMSATVEVTVQNAAAAEPWSFRNHVIPVLTRMGCNSGACHGALAGKGGLRLTLRGYDPMQDYNTLTRQARGRRIVPSAPAQSLMLLKPTAAVPHGGGLRFTTDSREYRVIVEWIADGCPPPREADARITGIEVFPPAAMLRPGNQQQILVTAHYSDGRTADVTRWAKFTSTVDGVATVDDDGLVEVAGFGQAAITVWYSNHVAVSRVQVPYDTPLDPAVFAQAERFNFIDEHVLVQLETLRIPPSPLCSDEEFIRRAYLDATGVLPTTAEVEAFLADPDPNKRARLIDALLQGPEFVDYWSYKWSDLLLVNSARLPMPAVWSFYGWIREQVEENTPWDQFARELLTATGSTLSNGAANYFVLHKDPIDLNETTSVTFLGMSITCARCHNHPLERWTLNDYYGMANLFARVSMKEGSNPGENIVVASPEGDVNHPHTLQPLPPRPLDGEAIPLEAPGDRREHYADWLTSPENPYFARAIVGRVWTNFMGRGLVDPPDDLRATNPASNDALFRALVDDFVAHGYDLRQLMRTIMNSAAYQRSSLPAPGAEADEMFYSHYLPRRLPAEVLLDAFSQVTESPTEFPGYPSGWRALQLPDSEVASYFLDSFGRAAREFTCECERTDESSISQALHLSNGETVNQKLRREGNVIDRMLNENRSDAEIVTHVYLAAYSRPPTQDELTRLTGFMSETIASMREGREGEPTPEEARAARRQVIEDLYWAVLTSNQFMFNH